MQQIVQQACREEDDAASDDPGQLPARVNCAYRDREQHAGEEPADDAGAAERRCRAIVPAFARRDSDESVSERGSQQCPEDDRRHRQGGERDGSCHPRRVVPGPSGGGHCDGPADGADARRRRP